MNNSAKRGIIFLLAVFLILGVTATLMVYAAGDDPGGGGGGVTSYTVLFNSNGGSAVASRTVLSGAKVSMPETPTKPGNSFSGWFIDEECTQPYNFDTVVNSSFTLYAKWALAGSGGGGTGGGGTGGSTIAELFPWPPLAKEVAEELGVDTSHVPSKDALASIQNMWVWQIDNTDEFASFEGLELLKGVESIYIGIYDFYVEEEYPQLDISGFPYLPNLTHLSLYGKCILGDISVFSSLTGLEYLSLYRTNISGDLSSLSSLTNLQAITAFQTNIGGNINSLSGLTDLSWLSLTDVGITGNLSSLSDLTNLESLFLEYTSVEGNLNNMAVLLNLCQLSLTGADIKGSLTDLSGLTNLQRLDLSDTQIGGALTDLSGFPSLQSLFLANTKISGKLTDLAVLPTDGIFRHLDLSGTVITGKLTDLTQNTSVQKKFDAKGLRWLALSRTAVTGKLSDLVPLNSLYTLELSDTAVTGNLNDLPNLKDLSSLKLENTAISGDLTVLATKLESNTTMWMEFDLGGTGVYGDTASIKTVRERFYYGGLADLSITLSPITFSSHPITIDVPVKIDGEAIEIKANDITGNGAFQNGKVTWQVPVSVGETLSYSFQGEDDIFGIYSGVIHQPYAFTSQGSSSSGSGSPTSYTVTFEAFGESSMTKQTVTAGAKAIKPTDPIKVGYVFVGWFTDRELTKEYNFDTAVNSNITLYAKGTEVKTETELKIWQNPFTDLKAGDWFYDHVRYVSDSGLMKGTGSTLFSPNARLNRGMLVTILYRLDGQKAINKPAGFNDVKEGMYYTDAVSWGEAKSIVKGYGDGAFKPEQTVTRQEIATVLLRYANFVGKGAGSEADTALGFDDAARVGDWAKEGVAFCVKNKIMEGRPGNILDPTAFATRAEFATMLHRFAELVK